MNDRFGNRGFSPVKEGEEHDVTIEAVGEKGDGIARIQGFVVFVPSVKEGDEVRIKITKVLRKVGFGEVVGEAKVSPKPKVEKVQPEKVKEEPEEVFDTTKDSEDFGEDEDKEE